MKENPDIQGKRLAVFTCFSGSGADKAIEKMKKYIGIDEFEAELILIDPKENVKAEDDEKIDSFCERLEKNGKRYRLTETLTCDTLNIPTVCYGILLRNGA